MATWNSRGLRGSTLEEFINRTNEIYQENGLALIQKIPTPITPINIDKQTRHITLAYFDQKSTVDYIGAVQGIPVCFDAKECNTDTFPLANIHEHQVAFMENFEKQGGVSFFLLSFTKRDEFYYLRLDMLLEFWKRAKEGGRKSFRYEELDPEYFRTADLNNPARVMRALEVCLQTHMPYSRQRTGERRPRSFEIVKIGIDLPRDVLYDRINRRVDRMLADGLEAEARALYPYRELNALKTVGYREFFDYFDGRIGYDEAVELIKRNSRRYAKRQLTWFRRDSEIRWFAPDDDAAIIAYVGSK